MAHIHTQPGQHDHTVSIYLFRTDFEEPKIMLHLHRKMQRYAQFGGHIELDETPWQTVVRELKEESGYDITQLKILQPRERMTTIGGMAVLHPYPVVHTTMGDASHFHTDSSYAFIANEKPRDVPGEGESVNIQLFTKAHLMTPDSDIIDKITRDIALYIFDECLEKWQTISPSEFK